MKLTKRKLNQFKGRLDPNQIAEGMNAAIQNARRLAEDAAILFEAGRFPSAASLAILSIEESGKCAILRGLALAQRKKKVEQAWQEYRSHKRKNVMWLLPELVSHGAKKLDDFRPLFDEQSDHPSILDQIKQIGFYTDCLGKAHWSIPSDVVDEELSKNFITMANIFAKSRNVTTAEIELWIKHMGPVWVGNPNWIKKALVNWYAEMQQRGLLPEGRNKMKEFINAGLSVREAGDQQQD